MIFFRKKRSIFLKKTQISERFENSIYSSRFLFYGKFATIWTKNNFMFRREENADVGVNAIGKHRVKKRQK